MDNRIEDIINRLKELCEANTPLMKRPTNEELRNDPYTHVSKLDDFRTMMDYGRNIKTSEPNYLGDRTYWNYPKGVEEKIEDDSIYKVWYRYRDAADPCDSTSWYTVYYIEKISSIKYKIISRIKDLINELE